MVSSCLNPKLIGYNETIDLTDCLNFLIHFNELATSCQKYTYREVKTGELILQNDLVYVKYDSGLRLYLYRG